MVLKSNQEIISELKARCQELKESPGLPVNGEISHLLKLLMESATQNGQRKNHGQRYERDLKLFSVYLFIVAGRMAYEFLSANLPNCLPSLPTVEKELKNTSSPVMEGIFRFRELKEFLLENNLPPVVAISEDGTRIQAKFCYNPASNQIVGPVLPLANNGLPITESFPATSAAMIATHFKKGIPAGVGYTFMAQSIRDGSPAFCLAVFGTDNKFSQELVYRRFKYIAKELEKIGIQVVAFSSDGDQKLLSAMHFVLFDKYLPIFKEEWSSWFYAKKNPNNFTVVQDAIHTLNKFRTRLSPTHFLVIGNHSVSLSHLKILVKNVDKGEHFLSPSDLNSEDKMNFNLSAKICSKEAIDSLKKYVVGSEGTVAYLTNMRLVLLACLDNSLSPVEKIFNIWHALFFLRLWKGWLIEHKSYNMDNFVTHNLYVCMEVIAHAYIILAVKCRNENTPEYFLPHLWSSQPCESFFRLARSMTTTQCTVINFTMKDLLERIKRIDILHQATAKLSSKLKFPREEKKRLLTVLTEEKLKSSYLPTDEEIVLVIENARNDAARMMNELGVKSSPSLLEKVKSRLVSYNNFVDEFELDTNEEDTTSYVSDITEDDISLDILKAFPSPNNLPNLDPCQELSAENVVLPETSIFTQVPSTEGTWKIIRKSTLCWYFSSNGTKMSGTRLERVRQSIGFVSNLGPPPATVVPGRKKEVEVGDWCIFRKAPRSKNIVVGQILGFTYLSGEGSKRAYTLPIAPTDPPQGKTARGLACICDWFEVSSPNVCAIKFNSYHNMKLYLGSIPAPVWKESSLQLVDSAIDFLKCL